MPRILFVHHASPAGGAENSLLDLVEALDDNWEPIVACPGGGELAARLEDAGARVEPLALTRFKRTACPLALARYFFAWRRGVQALVKIIKNADVDIVHSNSTTAHLYGGAAAGRCGMPAVWHVRDIAVPGIAKLILPKASACVAISQFAADCILSSAGAKAEVIYNGVDLELFHPGDGPPENPAVAMIGQLVPWKNHSDFLRAAAKVHGAAPGARFLIVGDDLFGDHPGYKEKLAALAEELGIGDAATFMGRRSDVPELLRSVSVLVLPSRREPFGRVVVEAMASGVPVAAYREGGPAEIILHEKTGLLVPPGDVAQLASAVMRLLRNPTEAKEFGEAGRARAAEVFDRRQTARRIAAVYSKLLETRG